MNKVKEKWNNIKGWLNRPEQYTQGDALVLLLIALSLLLDSLRGVL